MKKIKHYYTAIKGYSNDIIPFYKDIIDNAKDGQHFVEVGVFKGKSAAFMGVEIANSGKNIQFDLIDSWKIESAEDIGKIIFDEDVVNGTLYEHFLYNMKPIKNYVNPIRSDSAEGASLYKDNSLDFVFIDAGHTYESISRDIDAWLPKVKKGGIIAGHDYNNTRYNFNVAKAVNERFTQIENKYGSCWSVKL